MLFHFLHLFSLADSTTETNKLESETNGELKASKNETQEANTNEQQVNSFNSYPSNNFYFRKQTYQNYHKSQPRQFGEGEFSQNTLQLNGAPFSSQPSYYKNKPYRDNNKHFNNGAFKENQPNESDENTNHYYYRRHQPTQPTLSSYITNTDKSILFESKGKNQETSSETAGNVTTSTTNGQAATNETADASDGTVAVTNSSSSAPKQIHQQNEKSQINIQLKSVNIDPSEYNPKEFNLSPKAARFFVIKSYSEDDVHRSIKYNIWCSTDHGNRRLDMAFSKSDGNHVPVYLFFSVNGSGHFCGMAEMVSRVDYNRTAGVWSQDKWKGCLQVKWIYVKDVPNPILRNIKLENNDMKPVTNSRDTQEIPFDKGKFNFNSKPFFKQTLFKKKCF